jgi:hypothetical protein
MHSIRIKNILKYVRQHLYFLPNSIPVIKIMENKMGGACGLYWGKKYTQGVRGTTLKKEAASKTYSKYTRETNIKINFKETV